MQSTARPTGRAFGPGWSQYVPIAVLWLALVAVVWFFVRERTRDIETQAQAQALNQATIYAELLREFVGRTLGDIDQDLKLLRDYARQTDEPPDLVAWRSAIHAQSPLALVYGFVDAEGRFAASSLGQEGIGMFLGDRPGVQFHRAEPADRIFFGAPMIGPLTRRVTLTMSRRIGAPDGSFAGVALVSLDAVQLVRLFDRMRLRDDDQIGLVGTDGRIRARAGPTPLPENEALPARTIERFRSEPSGNTRRISVSDGIERFYAYRLLPEFDLIVYSGVPVRFAPSLVGGGIGSLNGIAWAFTVLTGLAALAIVAVLKRGNDLAISRALVDEIERRMAVIGGLLDRSDALLLAVTGDGRIRYANARCAELFGAPGTDVASAFRFPAEGGGAVFLSRLRESEAGPVSFEQQFVAPDGKARALLWVWSTEDRFAEGAKAHIGFGIDITERRRAEMAAIRSDKITSLGEIAASIVHELNQPLAVIGLAAANLRGLVGARAAIADIVPRLDRIELQVGRAAGILDRLRRYIAGAVGGPEQRFPAAEAAAAAREFVADQLRIDGIVLRMAMPTGAWLRGDRMLFEQLLVNLLLNARDAIVAGASEAPGSIDVNGVSAPGGRLRVTIDDTGSGLGAEAAARAFEPFFTTKSDGKGTGLGLPICRTIVQAFGGEIAIANGPRGARVVLDVPLDGPAEAPLAPPAAAQ
jgi:signal transduction histidine kinase